jgi:peptidoglycan hydrolase FlgJ
MDTTDSALAVATTPKEVGAPKAGKTDAETRKAAENFEGVFLSEMLGTMFESIPTDGPFGGGPGEGMMRSLMIDEYAKSMASRGGIGIADNVYRELVQIQESQHGQQRSH